MTDTLQRPRRDDDLRGGIELCDEDSLDLVEYCYVCLFRKLLRQNGCGIAHIEPICEERRPTNTGSIVAKKMR